MTSRSNSQRRTPGPLACAALTLCLLLGVVTVSTGGGLETGSDARYVHRDVLRDHTGAEIDPLNDPRPYSPKETCGKCHAYSQISGGWHFNALDPKVPAGRPGEPWILTDLATGTQLPLSYRAWPGTLRPERIGLTHRDFVQRFGRHLPGGGPGEKLAPDSDDADFLETFAGNMEIDCLSCHSADNLHDPTERSRQIQQGNVRWIPTAASGLGTVSGAINKLPPDFATDAPFALPEEWPEKWPQLPRVKYDQRRVAPDGFATLDITRSPEAGRCGFCHTTRSVAEAAPERWQSEPDIHLAAGMTCTDCHRSGIDHNIVRGYEQEATDTGREAVAAFTCQGCHLGAEGADGLAALGGRRGAPRPRHAGLPPVHFETLSCTACHSGPWPQDRAERVHTALAHGLGLKSDQRNRDSLPFIMEPVYLKRDKGKIAPHKVIWPAFWGLKAGDEITPLHPDAVKKATGQLLTDTRPPDKAAIVKGLAALKQSMPARGVPVYISGGRLFSLNKAGTLSDTSHVAAQPYAWPVAHNVRAAAQSLGARGCSDCHAKEAPFLFGTVGAESPTPVGGATRFDMTALQGADRTDTERLAASFESRWLFKSVCAVAALVLTLVLLICLGAGVVERFKRFGSAR